jgi:hypothetical protein
MEAFADLYRDKRLPCANSNGAAAASSKGKSAALAMQDAR